MCADPTLAHTNAKGGSMPKPSIRARKLGSMALSADTNIGQGEMPEGTGVLAYGQHAQYEHGAGRRIAKAGLRVVHCQMQPHLPKGVFPVCMYALAP